MPCAPQRFLANHRNLIAGATLTPSAVQAVANAVVETQVARKGTAQVKITGSYEGLDDATYDFEVLDDTADEKLVSTPVFNGAGSETLSAIGVSTAAQQEFTLECAIPGTAALAAKIEIEGVNIIARLPGTGGNAININVDETDLVYTATAFSLLTDLKKGAGSASAPVEGPEFDWTTATVGADDIIPTTAKRLVFEGDESNIYVQYKKFTGGKWQYFFLPEILNDYPASTKVLFVTGTRDVIISNGVTTDTLSAIVTVFDFLDAVKTTSVLCDVEGVVADDRSPTGQSARELNLHTDARHGYSYGTGSKAARGFTAVTVEDDSNTELITAECIGVSFKDLPLAYLGHEAWQLNGSVSGDLGIIYTGEPFVGATFGLTIPQRLPPSITQQKGKFTMTDVTYVGRVDPETEPPICFAGALGPNAVDQTITLVYTERTSGDCECKDMPFPELNGKCLGTGSGGDADVAYQDDTIVRLAAMWDWYADTVRSRSSLPTSATDYPNENPLLYSGAIVEPTVPDAGLGPTNSQTLRQVIEDFERTLALIDPLSDAGSPTYRSNGNAAWDTSLTELKSDVDGIGFQIIAIPTERYRARLDWALSSAGLSPLGKADANTLESGDGCWQDYGDPFFWTVVGSDGGLYAPAFNNRKYYSSRQAESNGKYYSTREFAFQLNIKCPDDLKVGDTITLVIGNAGQGSTYQIGDMLFLPLIAAQAFDLTGGRAASLVQTWYFTGSVAGAFAPYVFDPDAPVAYSSGGVTFLLVMGGIAPAKGDKFVWSVVGGHYRWRKDGGVWNVPSPNTINDGPEVFDDGLSFEFVRGVKPSFVSGDVFTFRALQQWQADNLRRPNRLLWYPGTAVSDMKALFDTGSPPDPQPLTHVALAYHTIPLGATIELVGGDVDNVVDWTEPIVWRAGLIAQKLSVERTGVWARLEITGGTGSAVGWWWAGVPDVTTLASDAVLKPAYKVERGAAGGLYQGGAYLGKATNAEIEWTEGALDETDAIMLTELLDHVKSNNDEPLVFIPQETRNDALLAQIIEDEVPLPDVFGYQPNDNKARRLSAHVTLQGVWG